MTEISTILLTLFIMFTAAKVAGELFERIHQPAVIGELLVGIFLGALGLIAHSSVYDTLAEIGAIFLLFQIGLETRASSIFRVGRVASQVAILGVLFPFLLGYLLMSALGYNTPVAMFMGVALVATSVGITARVLHDMGRLRTTEARVILGAAVIDDVVGMILLAVVARASVGELSWWYILLLAAEAIIFILFVSLVGTRAIRRYGSVIQHLRIRNAPFVVSIVVLLGLSALSAYIGLAAIIGAFFAGMMFAETRDQYALEQKVEPLYDFLVPFFFVIMGSLVDVQAFWDTKILLLALVITLLAFAGKLVGCGLGAAGLGWRRALTVGIGMSPRGEVGIIVALLGLSQQVITKDLYGAVVFMVVVTTLVVPPLLKTLFAIREQRELPRMTPVGSAEDGE